MAIVYNVLKKCQMLFTALSFQNFGGGGPLWAVCIPSGEVDFPYWTPPDVTVFLFCSANNLNIFLRIPVLSYLMFSSSKLHTSFSQMSPSPLFEFENTLQEDWVTRKKDCTIVHDLRMVYVEVFHGGREKSYGEGQQPVCRWFVPETSVSDLGHFGNKPQKGLVTGR